MTNRREPKRAPLIAAHAEGIATGALAAGLLPFFREAVGRRPGLYCLYCGETPYYVGLASSLRSRLEDHTKDHLEGKWDRFSFFEIHDSKAKYLEDLEALAIRIAKPQGNKVKPDFCTHHNKKRAVEKAVLKAVKSHFE